MTITYLGEKPEGRDAQNLKGIRTYTRVFMFQTSLHSEDAWDVGSHANAPNIGDTFHDAWCISSKPKCMSGKLYWEITAEYSSERELNNDPLLDPSIVTIDSEQFQRPVQGAVNSAGDPFDPPLMRDDSRRVFTVRKNVAVVPTWVLDYEDSVNSDSFSLKGLTLAIGTIKMQKVTVGELQSRNGTDFLPLMFVMHHNKNGWHFKPLDAGFRELDYNGDLVNILNPGDSEQPTAPVMLDGAGHQQTNPSLATAVYGDIEEYDTKAFSSPPLT